MPSGEYFPQGKFAITEVFQFGGTATHAVFIAVIEHENGKVRAIIGLADRNLPYVEAAQDMVVNRGFWLDKETLQKLLDRVNG